MNYRILSHNVWGMYAKYPIQTMGNRSVLMSRVYHEYLPDVIGLQEYSPDARESGLGKMLSDRYIEIDYSEDMGKYGITNLYTPMFYCPETCKLLDKGFILYDRNFNNRDSKGVTWGVFETKEGKVFSVCNTHYWWKKTDPIHDAARVENSKIILELCQKLPHPVVAMGDLNCNNRSDAFKALLDGGLLDVQVIAEETTDSHSHHPYPSYNEETNEFYGGVAPKGDFSSAIDHMVITEENAHQAKKFDVITTQDALDTSDHCPFYVDLEV